jgi:DNA-binding response OmpR family regulator
MRSLSQVPGDGVRAGGARVLVVEDEPIVGMDIEAILSEAGLEVVGPVSSVSEALELISSAPIECALIDFVLTDGNALDVVARLTDSSIPFAFVTGVSRDGIPAAYGDIPTVGKPFAAAELVSCVRNICSRAA